MSDETVTESENAGDGDLHVPTDLMELFEIQEWEKAVKEAESND